MFKKILFHLMAMAILLGVAACAAPDVASYKAQTPTLDLRTFFNGPLTAHGVFTDRSGAVVRRFVVKMNGTWNGNEGVLDEHFDHLQSSTAMSKDAIGNMGTKERRVWKLKYLEDKNGVTHYSGTADDVIGVAVGLASGNALKWQYTLRLLVDGKTWDVQFDDWMYLVDDRVMINKAVMTKFGVTLGEVTLSIVKDPSQTFTGAK